MTQTIRQPKLPDYISPISKGRPSASRLNSLANKITEKTLTVAAEGAMCPILYGEVNVGGLLFALGFNGPNLVVGYIWGIGEVESIDTIYINDSDMPPEVIVNHYTGTLTQGVDPLLANAIPAYLDTLRVTIGGETRGLAYSVLEIPPDAIDGFPRVRATIKGRKVLDPRTMTVAFSDNPSLCMADLISDTFYGLGVNVYGADDCANWNDELLGGLIARSKLSLVISSGRPIPEYLDALSEYAECWYTYEGDGVRMTPDRIVDLTQVPVVGADTIIKDSLKMNRASLKNAPTEVEIRYTKPTNNAEPWKTESVVRALPEVEDGTMVRIPTSVSLEGVYRDVEAANRAISKLNRLRDQVKVSWISTDIGILRQLGDVVIVENPARGFNTIPVRIEKADMTSAGRYGITGSLYSPTHYPSEIDPTDDGIVPEGAIGLLSGEGVPNGWADFSDANDKFIKIFSDTEPVGTIGGSLNIVLPVSTTTQNPSHGVMVESYYTDYESGGSEIGYRLSGTSPTGYDHAHAVAEQLLSPDLLHRKNRLVIKVNGGSVNIPKQVMTFGLDGILDGNATRVTQYEGRILQGSIFNQNAGPSGEPSYTVTTESADNSHTHGSVLGPFSNMQSEFDFGMNPYAFPRVGGGVHTHQLTLFMQNMLKKYPLALYAGINDYSVRAGRMFLWAGDVNNLPQDFVLVETAKDHFLEISGQNTGNPSGDNTLRFYGKTDQKGHKHIFSEGERNKVFRRFNHSNIVNHGHDYDLSVPYQPPYYCLALIMYQPQD